MLSPTRYLTEQEWNDNIRNNRFEPVGSTHPDLLKQLNRKQSLLLEINSVSRVNFSEDGHTWSHSASKSKHRHRPVYRSMMIDGKKTHVNQCTDYYNPDFRKDVLKLDQKTFVHYFLKAGSYKEPEVAAKEPRIDEEQKHRVRDFLKNRTIEDAYHMAKEAGISVSKRQIRNQSKHVPESKKSDFYPRISKKQEEKKRKISEDIKPFICSKCLRSVDEIKKEDE